MPRRVIVRNREEVFHRSVFRIEAAHLQYEKYDGSMSDEIVRMSLERGDSVAAVVHNAEVDTVLLIEQFRYPTLQKNTGWLLELPAGIVEGSDDPIDTMHRELHEEIGYRAGELEPICSFFLSPGGSSERIHLFYARVTDKDYVAEGGGLVSEGEDIQLKAIPVDEAISYIEAGKIVDAKTIIGLQWLQVQRLRL